MNTSASGRNFNGRSRLSTRGRLILAERSGHNIFFDQPKIIVESIEEMVNSNASQIELPQKEVTMAR